MKKFLFIIALLAPACLVSAQKNTPRSYIEQFKDDAIRIMHQTGVPASIVLGVAMHESGCGNSALAQHLNNQFGVKGNGHIVYYQRKKKVRTAYKRYESVYDSFNDFARIMMERSEFSALSGQFTHFDYDGWANGIQKHGYASDRKWSKYVLGIIKKYQLYMFDEKPVQAPTQFADAGQDFINDKSPAAKP
jgi:flagellum-specific peptidoglycan hydrolase FlgJ